eukprot:5325512-Prymnesium_polylepis.1
MNNPCRGPVPLALRFHSSPSIHTRRCSTAPTSCYTSSGVTRRADGSTTTKRSSARARPLHSPGPPPTHP